jgi:hypothetical protein
MENKFSDHNEFDKHVREQDKWIYDNGWSYKGEHFSAYMLERFDRVESGKLVEYLVMLRDENDSNKTIILYGKDTKLAEIWSGVVNSQNDYQAMMAVVNRFIEECKNN